MTGIIKRRRAPITSVTDPDIVADQINFVPLEPTFEESAQAKQAQDANTITGWRILAIGCMGVNGLLLLSVIGLQLMANMKPVAPFVTRGNGEIETLEYLAGNKRSPELIVDFIRKSMIGIFTFRGTLPEEGNPPDPGVAFGKGKISTTSYRYTFALATEFAQVFRVKLAEITAEVTNNNSTEAVYIPANISQPTEVSAGVWTVDVVGNLFIKNVTTPGNSIPINRRITVRASPPLTLSEVSLMYKDKGLANAVARVRASGLEITNMVSLPSK
jgi:hypothetical protein